MKIAIKISAISLLVMLYLVGKLYFGHITQAGVIVFIVFSILYLVSLIVATVQIYLDYRVNSGVAYLRKNHIERL
jgi:hypothetical protein